MNAKLKEVKQVITKKRIEITDEKSKVDKLGDESITVFPEDLQLMYASKITIHMMKGHVAAGNILGAFKRAYKGKVDDFVLEQMDAEYEKYCDDFKDSKKRLLKIAEKHELWNRFKDIRGLTAYSLGLVMAYLKNPERFSTPSGLMVYAGIGCVEGIPVTKANINKIKQIYSDKGKEFAGFNTELSGRMFTITESLLKARGWFLDFYTKKRNTLKEKAINEGRAYMPTPEQIKESKGKMKKDTFYMHGKKNQSIDAYTHSNAIRRCSRILLHLILNEWKKMHDMPVRIPYPIEYLGHETMITLDEIIKFDQSVVVKNKRKED